jgi:hypothetical protein
MSEIPAAIFVAEPVIPLELEPVLPVLVPVLLGLLVPDPLLLGLPLLERLVELPPPEPVLGDPLEEPHAPTKANANPHATMLNGLNVFLVVSCIVRAPLDSKAFAGVVRSPTAMPRGAFDWAPNAFAATTLDRSSCRFARWSALRASQISSRIPLAGIGPGAATPSSPTLPTRSAS